MGKRSRQKPDGVTATATASGNPLLSAGEPLLSAGFLSKLTQTNQTNLEKAKVQLNENPTRVSKDKKGKKYKKDKKCVEELPAGKLEQSAPKKSDDKKKSIDKKHSRKEIERPAEPSNDTRSKKRARDGESKPQTSTAPKQKPVLHAAGTGKEILPQEIEKKGKIDKEALLKEIMELGGTQEDLDLVNGIDSDSEIEVAELSEQSSDSAGKGLQIELVGFMKEIGLEGGKFDTPDNEEMENEEWEVGDEDEDENMDEQEEEKTAPPVTTFAIPSNPKSRGNKLLFPPRPDWYAHPLPELSTTIPTPSQIETLHKRGKELLTTENSTYYTTHLTKSSDRLFLSTIMTSGTLTDKISALTLICQESPLHTTKSLESLLGLARKKSRSQAVSAMGAIKDLFASGVVLPPNRKLRYFSKQQGLGGAYVMDVHLLVWAYEDWLKNFYFEILKTLEGLCGDQLEFSRTQAVGYIWELLKEKPEQEANLLRLLVNKLGDTDKKVSSKVSFLLLKLQSTHPAMKSIIINSIETEVVFRPGNNIHAKYYATITLNQTILSTREVEIANKLLNLYFSVFTSLLKNAPAIGVNAIGLGSLTTFDSKSAPLRAKGGQTHRKARLRVEAEEKGKQFTEEMNTKLISAVLTGVNRAFPFSQMDDEVFQQYMNTLFRITHSGNFNTSIQALLLIFQVANSKQAVSDRFYRTLYESLLDQRLIGSSKQAMYLNLLFKALKTDTQINRVKAFVKRLIQISTFHQPPFICGVLFLLCELEAAIPPLHSLMDTPQETFEDEEAFRDVPEEGDWEKKEITEEQVENMVEYDGRKRDPSHANADRSCLWELLPFLNYYHPSVALFASRLLEKRKMPSKPDLGMHTLVHFLDRFVYRGAKSTPSTCRGASIMQPLSDSDTRSMVLSTRGAGRLQPPVNSGAFWKQEVEVVAVDEVFFHKYFNQVTPKKSPAARIKKSGGSHVDDEENEEEIWKVLVGSRPELEGDDMSSVVEFDDDDEVASNDEKLDKDFDNDGDGHWGDDAPDDLAEAFETELQVADKRQKRVKVVETSDEDEVSNRKKRRRKLKSLPTFASADDYADILSD